MEGLRALVSWLAVTDLDHLDPEKGKAIVKEALDALHQEFDDQSEEFEEESEEFDDVHELAGDEVHEEEDEESLLNDIFDALESIYEDFLGGGVPATPLREFYHRYQSHFVEEREAAGVVLERDLRELADQLSEEEWCTESYLKLERGIHAFLDGNPDLLEEVVEEMETVLDEAWNPYSNTPLGDSEITAETVVGHTLLTQGVHEWIQALDFVRAATEEADPDWQSALDAAQLGNRLLIAVQKFNQRLQSQV